MSRWFFTFHIWFFDYLYGIIIIEISEFYTGFALIKKQIQKIFLAIFATLVLLSVFPVVQTTNAQINPQGPPNCAAFDPTSPETFESRIYVDKTDSTKGSADRQYGIGQTPIQGPATQIVAPTEEILLYVEVSLPSVYSNCANELKASSDYKFLVLTSGPRVLSLGATFDQSAKKWHAIFRIKDWSSSNNVTTYFCKISGCSLTDINDNDYIERFSVQSVANPSPAATIVPPSTPLLSGGDTIDLDTVRDYKTVKTKIVGTTQGAEKKGLRVKYRVKWDDPEMNFGVTPGLDPIHMEWDGEPIRQNQYFSLPQKDNGWGFDLFTPFYVGSSVYFNEFNKLAKLQSLKEIVCKPDWLTTDCTGVVYNNDDKLVKGRGSELTQVPGDFKPVLFKDAWQLSIENKPSPQQLRDGNAGKPLGSIDFGAIPVIVGFRYSFTGSGILGQYLIDNGVYLMSGGGELKKFTVEVYATDADIIAACKADASISESNKAKCDTLTFAKYGFAETLSQTTNPTEAESKTPTQTLYSFILNVISAIILFLTTQIYKIFAFFLVPVINALLQVRPYQDAFVNIIYPGWLILRNLANIFFIIALLVVGLRILFQQSEAATAASFIRRLIIMALLVNFSLVIAQGVVGIADTVQSQFLPANTKVIEALGTKLMVEPIQSFTGSIAASGSEINGNLAITDLTKPIILLLLAVASFFAFIAIAGFLAVRLVGLMLLYMLSPIAYVGQVMQEGKGYASKWWDEFVKYAFMTPIMVFFLNIAALVATATSSSTGNVIKLDENLESDIIAGGLTIVSQLIVLLVLVGGMRIALGFSAASASKINKTIADFAENGFKKTFKKPAQWIGGAAKQAGKGGLALGKLGKDLAGDKSTAWLEKKGYSKSAALVSAIAQPKVAYSSVKEKFLKGLKDSKKKQMERLAGHREGMEEFAYNVGSEPWKMAKMATWKARGKASEHLRSEAEELKSIMTDAEKASKKQNISTTQNSLDQIEQKLANNNTTSVTVEEANRYKSDLEKRIKDAEDEHVKKLDELTKSKNEAIRKGNQNRVKEIQQEISVLDDKHKKSADPMKQELDNLESRLEAVGPNELTIPTLEAEGVKILNLNAKELKATVDTLDADIGRDAELRKKHGVFSVDDRTKELLLQQAADLERLAQEREFKGEGDAARYAKEKEAENKFKDIDDPEVLKDAFRDALKKNNMDAATALIKKLTKGGELADLLKDYGKDNNVEDLKKFMDEKLKSIPVTVRTKILSEVSYLASQNGNHSLGNATTIDKNRIITPNTISQQQEKIGKAGFKKPMSTYKKNDLTYQKDGKYKFNKGAFEALNALNDQKLKSMKGAWSPDLAAHVLQVADERLKSDPGSAPLEQQVRTALNEIKAR